MVKRSEIENVYEKIKKCNVSVTDFIDRNCQIKCYSVIFFFFEDPGPSCFGSFPPAEPDTVDPLLVE